MSRVGIRHLSVTLGEEKVWYRQLPDIERQIQRLEIPDDEELWNWGYCRRARADYDAYIACGFAGLTDFLAAHGVVIDALLVCGPVRTEMAQFVSALRSGVLPRVATRKGEGELRLIEDLECANVLQALADGRELIRSGHEHVLIVAAEKEDDERRRFRKYSVTSDFCLALVLSRDLARCEYEILDVQMQPDHAPGEDTSGILLRDLETECIGRVLGASGVSLEAVSRMFYLNLFEPIAEMKVKRTGFTRSQIYTDATKETGHCYGADPFINLQRYGETGGKGSMHVLCASGRTFAGVSLLSKLAAGR